ncbi:MAG TPA: YihY/virulence factor BrkB family protein [Bacteroidales bacterium]|nr:YihY/virulence factor BrkB family protein [Bacteroidales bacterium]
MANYGKKRDRDEYKPSRFERWGAKVRELIYFLTYGIWRSDPDKISNKRNVLYNATKTIILTVRNIRDLNIPASARSLTYRTLLSIVPLLAVLFAIARGFGIENILESSIFNLFSANTAETEVAFVAATPPDTLSLAADQFGQTETDSLTTGMLAASEQEGVLFSEEATAEGRFRELMDLLFQLINNSLEQAKGGGLFAGIGIMLLLYTILLLFNDIEKNFNQIWQVRKGRSIGRKVTDYAAMVLLMPVFFIIANALNILSYPQNQTLKIIYILYPFIPQLMGIVPYVVIILLFTILYKFVPNTRVKFKNALIAGVITGVAFQIFQMLFLSGQLWITRYNAIYGTFALIPLMLLWIQFSWFITLIGAEISYAAQNVGKFSFEKETRRISRRYKDFFTIIIASEIVRRFANEKPPLTAEEISEKCKSPSRLTNNILDKLLEIGVISATISQIDEREVAFQPAVDIQLITVNYLMSKLDKNGSEDFMIDTQGTFHKHWKALVDNRMYIYESDKDVLLKDL